MHLNPGQLEDPVAQGITYYLFDSATGRSAPFTFAPTEEHTMKVVIDLPADADRPPPLTTTVGTTDPAQAIIEDRNDTHGDYEVQAALSQSQKDLLRGLPGWQRLSPEQRETLDMVCVKMSRILCGNPNEPDHWLDMMGYVKLVHNQLVKGKTV